MKLLVGIIPVFLGFLYLMMEFKKRTFKSIYFKNICIVFSSMLVITIISCLSDDGSMLTLLMTDAFMAILLFSAWRANKTRFVILRKFELSTEDYDELLILFLRCEELMSRTTIYCQDLDIMDLASKLGTNRFYLSKAINKYANKNYRQYINCYRIQYAMKLFREDPDIKLVNLALLSGFHSHSAFTMAFKLVTDTTPMEWTRAVREELKAKSLVDELQGMEIND